ncbi:MAG: hypothetical protein HY719_04215 [Planctomycetes bacterium]|nr:hypothetical protein [Planctomycetota bacterium]
MIRRFFFCWAAITVVVCAGGALGGMARLHAGEAPGNATPPGSTPDATGDGPETRVHDFQFLSPWGAVWPGPGAPAPQPDLPVRGVPPTTLFGRWLSGDLSPTANPLLDPREIQIGLWRAFNDMQRREESAAIHEDQLRWTVTGSRASHQRIDALRRALEVAVAPPCQVSISFVRLSAEQRRAFGARPSFARIVPDAVAEALVNATPTARRLLVTAPEGVARMAAQFVQRTFVGGFFGEIAQGAGRLDPVPYSLPLGEAAVVTVNRLAASAANLVLLQARCDQAVDPWRTAPTEAGEITLPRERFMCLGAEFVLPDGAAALLGAPAAWTDDDALPTVIVLRLRGGAVGAYTPVALPGYPETLFRATPLAAPRAFFSWPPPLEWRRDPGPPTLGVPGPSPPARVAPVGEEVNRMWVALRDPEALGEASALCRDVATCTDPNLTPTAIAKWTATREADFGRQYAVTVRLVEGALPGAPAANPSEEALAALLAAIGGPADPPPRAMLHGGTILLMGGESILALQRREAIVVESGVEIAQGYHLDLPVVGAISSGANLRIGLRPTAAGRVEVVVRGQIGVIDSLGHVETGGTVIDLPRQQLVDLDRVAELAPGATAVLAAGSWRSGGTDLPLSLLVTLARVEG